jgi:hypothetical protein
VPRKCTYQELGPRTLDADSTPPSRHRPRVDRLPRRYVNARIRRQEGPSRPTPGRAIFATESSPWDTELPPMRGEGPPRSPPAVFRKTKSKSRVNTLDGAATRYSDSKGSVEITLFFRTLSDFFPGFLSVYFISIQ